jgi:oxygen-dependent protoporphyrinogen oxidase
VVVGGGVSGLAAAYRLRQRAGDSAEIVVLERSERLGGKIHTLPFEGRMVETGAETFLMRESGADSTVLMLVRELGLGDDLVHPVGLPAAIAVDGALRPIPGGTLLGIPADPGAVPFAPAPDAARSDVDKGHPVIGTGEDQGVGVLVRGRYGDAVVDRLVDPMLGGVYAGRADELSIAVTMPGLFAAAQREHTLSAAVRAAAAAAPRPPGSPIFGSLRGGLSQLIEALAESSAAQVRLGTTVRDIVARAGRWEVVTGPATSEADPMTIGVRTATIEADAVVIAVPAVPTERLLGGVTGERRHSPTELAYGPRYASVALVTMAFPPGTTLAELSGFLVPATEGYAVKAATFFSSKWAHLRAGANRGRDNGSPGASADGAPVLVRVSIGRHGEEAQLQRSDSDLTARAYSDLAALCAFDPAGGDAGIGTPLRTRVNRWGGALPQYAVGHTERTRQLRALLPDTIALAGAAWDGVGIAACVRSGQVAADAVCSALGE